jgi:hypothetical protein
MSVPEEALKQPRKMPEEEFENYAMETLRNTY